MRGKTIRINEDGHVDLKEFDDLVDIMKVVYYEITAKSGGLVIKFYDKDENLILPYVGKNSVDL